MTGQDANTTRPGVGFVPVGSKVEQVKDGSTKDWMNGTDEDRARIRRDNGTM